MIGKLVLMELFFNLEEQLLTTLIPCPTLTLYMLQLLDQTDVQLLPIYMLMSTLFQYVVLLLVTPQFARALVYYLMELTLL